VTDISIESGRALLGGEIVETSLRIADGKISAVGPDHRRGSPGIDASGLLVLPGIIDLHGDAFERQMMPRPGVDFPVDVALVDSDRQAISNGITTVYHATTWSWEPGLRSGDNARQLLEAIESLRSQFAADTRFHLRHETYNLDAEAEIGQWLSEGRIDLFAFNDHMDSTVAVWPSRKSAAAWSNVPVFRASNSMVWWSASFPAPTTSPHRSRGWPKRRGTQKSGCCRTTTKALPCEGDFAPGRRHRRISRQRGNRA